NAHVVGVKGFEMIDTGVAVALAIGAGEDVHGTVVVLRTEHVVEEDPAVEEAPADIAHHCAQEAIDFDRVFAFRPADVHEVHVALEGEAAELELAIAKYRIGFGSDDFCVLGDCHVHDSVPRKGASVGFRDYSSTQISDHFSTLSGPIEVWISATEGFAAFS